MQPNPITASAALMLAGSLLLAATLAPAAEVPQQTLRQLRESGQILPLEKISAAAKAIKPGEILETELETKPGGYVYEVEILDTAGAVWELKLDAATGKLIEMEAED